MTSLLFYLASTLFSDRPVIRLDEIEVTGNIRKPQIIEIEKSHLDKKLEITALSNLVRLERELLKPRSLEKGNDPAPNKP